MLNLVFNFYNYFSTKIENSLFKRKEINQNSNLIKNGFELIKLKKKFKIKLDNKKTISNNKYLKKYILKKKQLDEVIDNVFFSNNLKEILEKKLGFKFNINFILAYKTYNIDKKDVNHGWYANHWHKDKAYSKNIIKLIIPLQKIGPNDGGIQVYKKNLSIENLKKLNNKNGYIFKGDENNILILNPNECFHKAGNPKTKPRSQIMIQLNPNFDWTKDVTLYKKQFKLEPKFPLIKTLISRKVSIKWKN